MNPNARAPFRDRCPRRHLVLGGLLALLAAAPALAEMPNGVAVGDLDQTSAVLWARSTAVGTLTFQVDDDPNFGSPGSFPVEVTDPLQPVKVIVEPLPPGALCHFRAIDADGDIVVGSFPMPDASGTSTGFRMGVSGDWRGDLAPFPAIGNVTDRTLDLFVELGDTIRADVASPDVPAAQATTLAEFRAKHAEVYAERTGVNAWADLRSSVSVLGTLDDGEITTDFDGGAAPASDPRFGNEAVTFINDTTLFETGVQAFSEYMPLRDLDWGDLPNDLMAFEPKFYRYKTWGDDAAIFTLDNRSFRSPALPDPDPTNVTSLITFLNDTFEPGRTLLGPAQLGSLLKDLQAAHDAGITWKFVVMPEPMQNLGPIDAANRFEGYAAERTAILRHIDDNFITNVVFVTANLHGTVVNNLTYQSIVGSPQLASPAFEVITGAVAADAPFGPQAVDLAADAGLLSPADVATYEALGGSAKDAFVADLIDQQASVFGYDQVGLDDSMIPATLVRGSEWVAGHTFGWTEFDVDDATDTLRVTTFGIDPYDAADLAADPVEVAARTPTVAQEFTVDAVRPCVAGEGALCLGNGRFALEVEWTDFAGNTGAGLPVELTPDSGYFYFFRPENIELVVKALDGRELNDSRWIFYGALTNVAFRMTVTDRQTGQVRTYDNPSGVFASNGDVEAFPQIIDIADTGALGDLDPASIEQALELLAANGATPNAAIAALETVGTAPATKAADFPIPTKDCTASATTLCLSQDRFRVSATFTVDGETRQAASNPLTSDTGYFWFGSIDNVELVVKVLDGRELNDTFWVFYASLSNLEFEIRVTDTDTGDVVTYTNDGGAFASVGDTSAFPQGN